jgi:hypothetical protein
MLVSLNTGLLLWVVYGVWIRSWPIIVPNIATLLLSIPILLLKLRHRRLPKAVQFEPPARAPAAPLHRPLKNRFWLM